VEFTTEQRLAFLDHMRFGMNVDRPQISIPKYKHLVSVFILNPGIVGQTPMEFEGGEVTPAYIALPPERDRFMRARMGVERERVHRSSLGRFAVFTDQAFILGYLSLDPARGPKREPMMRTCSYDYACARIFYGSAFETFCESIKEHRLDDEEVYRGLRTYLAIVHEMGGLEIALEVSAAVDMGPDFQGVLAPGGEA